ncbi:carbohydrate ABC transporter permease [Leucobacter chromiireducens]|uniref:Carbohydrate ABC transporter permease n=1 Tax=Leucobacter chromiireducens subsp. solipictus TaxID=398235 RepID=A0ABS1SIH2_9MICO|nr:carbohydrate ABC transporter permease [Leucobacter chromiireducens]MBL3680364.1 carbohydrate ABC transporter permease [Leucobacter chromiireducens subsp. solipictus]
MTFTLVAPQHRDAPAAAAPIDSATRALRGARRRRRFGNIPAHVVMTVLAIISVFPIYWMFVTAFRPADEMLSTNPFPGPFSLENFQYVWDTIPILGMLGNTFGMALVLAVGQLLVAILAAYGFARWSFRGQKILFLLFVGSWLVPFQVTMIPNYVLISKMGLLNTILGVMVPQLATAFAVMLLRQHLESFPRELLDAAEMDGRGPWRTLWEVVVPNLRPALAALGIMLFINAWNEYLWPSLIMQQSTDLIQVGIRGFMGAEGNNWGAIMAASALACLPILGIYVFLQRYVVDAFVRSGLK